MNIEQEISNDEVKRQIAFTSKFIIPCLSRFAVVQYSIFNYR